MGKKSIAPESRFQEFIMKLFLLFALISAYAIFGQIEGDVVNCKADADCGSSMCCVSFKTGGPSFCRVWKQKGEDCDLKGNFAWCPCVDGLKCVDGGNWPMGGVIGKCQ